MKKLTVASLLVLGSSLGTMPLQAHFGLRAHNSLARHMEKMWRDFDTLFDIDVEGADDAIRDTQSVVLPQMTLKAEKDKVSIQVTGLKAKDADIKGEYDEENDSAQLTFPHQDSLITVQVYPRGIVMTGQKKITEEKKDPSGKVISSSNYTAYNEVSERLPIKVNVSKIVREYKDGVLTITLIPRYAKRPF